MEESSSFNYTNNPNELLKSLEMCATSLSILETFEPDDKVYYDKTTGMFSSSTVKHTFEYMGSWAGWGVQSLSRSFYGESSQTTVEAFGDFEGKLKETVEKVNTAIQSGLNISDLTKLKEETKKLKETLKDARLNNVLDNLQKTYESSSKYDQLLESIQHFKEAKTGIDEKLEEIIPKIEAEKLLLSVSRDITDNTLRIESILKELKKALPSSSKENWEFQLGLIKPFLEQMKDRRDKLRENIVDMPDSSTERHRVILEKLNHDIESIEKEIDILIKFRDELPQIAQEIAKLEPNNAKHLDNLNTIPNFLNGFIASINAEIDNLELGVTKIPKSIEPPTWNSITERNAKIIKQLEQEILIEIGNRITLEKITDIELDELHIAINEDMEVELYQGEERIPYDKPEKEKGEKESNFDQLKRRYIHQKNISKRYPEVYPILSFSKNRIKKLEDLKARENAILSQLS